MFLEVWIDDCLERFTRWTNRRGYLFVGFWIALISYGMSVMLYIRHGLWNAPYHYRLPDFYALCANPWERNLSEPLLAYRIITPTFSWFLGLSGTAAVVLPYIAMVLTLWVLFIALARRTGPATALLTTLGLSLTFLTVWTTNWPGYPDAVTHLATALCLLTPHPALGFFMTLIGALNDERFVLALPFLVLWHFDLNTFWKNFWIHWRWLLSLIGGLVGVILIRHALTEGWIGPGISHPSEYSRIYKALFIRMQPVAMDGNAFFFALVSGFRWMWLLPLTALIHRSAQAQTISSGLVKEQRNKQTICQENFSLVARLFFGGALVIVSLACLAVEDVARSVGFFFPAVALAVALLHKSNFRLIRRLLLLALGLCIFTPAFTIVQTNYYFFFPLPYEYFFVWEGFF